jgi:hypothetical protein
MSMLDGIEGSVERLEEVIEEGFKILQDFSIDELMQKLYDADRPVLIELLSVMLESIDQISFLTEKK